MTFHHSRSTVRRGVAAVAAISFLVGAVASPAAAARLKGFSIDAREGATATVSFPVGSIPGTDPAGEFILPEDCAELPTCAVIRLSVAYPEGFDRDLQEFFLDVSVSWDQGKTEVDAGRRVAGQQVKEGVQGNDLDTWFYTKLPDPKDPKKLKDTEIARSATAKMPEKVRLFGGYNDYEIVVVNYAGVNRGFRIDATFVPAFITKAFSGEDGTLPAFQNDSTSTGAGSFGSGDDEFSSGPGGFLDLSTPGPAAARPGGSGFSSTPAPLLAPTGVDFPAVTGASAISETESFGEADPEFDAALAGTQTSASSLFEEARRAGPAKPVAGALLLFWLGFVPLALAFGAAVLFIRRRPVSLSFDIGAPATA